jgi:hypothetical protein
MPASRSRQILAVFARRPRIGVGKRRLAAEAGELCAYRFQRRTLDRLVRGLAFDPRWRTVLALSDAGRGPKASRPAIMPQGRGDLGSRLTRLLAALPSGNIVIIGSDAPGVRASDIKHAFDLLGPCDAVLGPALDGGFWLIGLAHWRRRPSVFQKVRWSSAETMSDVLLNLGGRRVALLRRLEDVDDLASLRRAQAERPSSHQA